MHSTARHCSASRGGDWFDDEICRPNENTNKTTHIFRIRAYRYHRQFFFSGENSEKESLCDDVPEIAMIRLSRTLVSPSCRASIMRTEDDGVYMPQGLGASTPSVDIKLKQSKCPIGVNHGAPAKKGQEKKKKDGTWDASEV